MHNELKNSDNSAYARGLRLLARREHARAELAKKLAMRGFSSDDITAALDTLSANGYLSDERFTDMLIYSRMQQGYGPKRIQYELKQHAIAAEIINTALAAITTDEWQNCMKNMYERKYDFGASTEKTIMPDKQQVRAFFYQRGFSYAQIDTFLHQQSTNI